MNILGAIFDTITVLNTGKSYQEVKDDRDRSNSLNYASRLMSRTTRGTGYTAPREPDYRLKEYPDNTLD